MRTAAYRGRQHMNTILYETPNGSERAAYVTDTERGPRENATIECVAGKVLACQVGTIGYAPFRARAPIGRIASIHRILGTPIRLLRIALSRPPVIMSSPSYPGARRAGAEADTDSGARPRSGRRALDRARGQPHVHAIDTTHTAAGNVLRICVRDDGRGGADSAGGTGFVGTGTGPRHSAVASRYTAPPAQAPPCMPNSRCAPLTRVPAERADTVPRTGAPRAARRRSLSGTGSRAVVQMSTFAPGSRAPVEGCSP